MLLIHFLDNGKQLIHILKNGILLIHFLNNGKQLIHFLNNGKQLIHILKNGILLIHFLNNGKQLIRFLDCGMQLVHRLSWRGLKKPEEPHITDCSAALRKPNCHTLYCLMKLCLKQLTINESCMLIVNSLYGLLSISCKMKFHCLLSHFHSNRHLRNTWIDQKGSQIFMTLG